MTTLSGVASDPTMRKPPAPSRKVGVHVLKGFLIRPDQIERLEQTQWDTGKSHSEQVREALDAYFKLAPASAEKKGKGKK